MALSLQQTHQRTSYITQYFPSGNAANQGEVYPQIFTHLTIEKTAQGSLFSLGKNMQMNTQKNAHAHVPTILFPLSWFFTKNIPYLGDVFLNYSLILIPSNSLFTHSSIWFTCECIKDGYVPQPLIYSKISDFALVCAYITANQME